MSDSEVRQPAPIEHERRMLIDGKLRDAAQERVFEVLNPATGEVAGVVANASAADMDDAIAAARNAFDTGSWTTDRSFRERALRQLRAALDCEREEFRRELIEEVGAPLMSTYGSQLDWPIDDTLPWVADEIGRFGFERRIADSNTLGSTSQRWVFKEPVGVVGAIVPWNFPFEILISKLAPALATGNTVVVKASPETPWNATRVGRLIAEKTDIPPGVVNIVTTDDVTVAQTLVSDPRVDMISFTGSTATGRLIAREGAATMKRTLLELGGKSAAIVLDDADLAMAARSAAGACFHAGQVCAGTSRFLVHRSIYDEMVAMLGHVYAALPVGDPRKADTLCGPVASARQRDNIMAMIGAARSSGAELVVGGGVPDGLGSDFDKGFWVQPTLFVGVDNSSKLAQEEVFGPVLAVTPFDDDADAVRLANDSRYGLSGSVFTASAGRAMSIARSVRTGTLAINGGNYSGPDAPFGGFKASGVGRQGGPEGFASYLETKTIGSTLPLGAEVTA